MAIKNNKTSKKNTALPLIILVILISLFTKSSFADDHDENIELFKLFLRVFSEVEDQYVDDIDSKELMYSALRGMLQSLDPYSTYLSEDDFKEMEVDTKGFYGGLGLEVTLDANGFVRVISPIDDTPAAKAGIITGDYITSIDGEDVYGLTLDEAVSLMRGYANTPITLTIFREGEDSTFDVKIIREIIQITPVKYRLLDENIAYILSLIHI